MLARRRLFVLLSAYALIGATGSVAVVQGTTIAAGGQSGTTLLGHAPGTPDPNWRYRIEWRGFPFPWQQWGQVRNEAQGVDETRVETNRAILVAEHLLVWTLPVTVFELLASLWATVRRREITRSAGRQWRRGVAGVACCSAVGGIVYAALACLMFGWLPNGWLTGLHHRIGIPYGWQSYTRLTIFGICVGAAVGCMICAWRNRWRGLSESRPPERAIVG
jgi:hypothetical protein